MPRTFDVIWVDAFTDTPLQGNPCLVVLNADGLSEIEMQAIARETNLSETAFILPSSVAQFRARYFTPAEEIPLAGHPTMAVSRALVTSGQLSAQATHYSLQLQAGVIQVALEDTAQGTRFMMTQKPPAFLSTYSAAEVLPIFGLDPDEALSDVPIQTVSTGTPQLMIPLRRLEALRAAQMNHAAYAAFRARSDFFSPHLFCVAGITPAGATFARHFGTPPDTTEDPFTGSATGGMAAYLWRYGLLETPQFIAEQGHWMGRPGQAWVRVHGAREAIETVQVGGHAVCLLQGTLTI